MATVNIRVPCIVTADGKWAASSNYACTEGEPDWGWIEEMCDPENPLLVPRRFILTAIIEVPDDATVEIAAGVERSSDDRDYELG